MKARWRRLWAASALFGLAASGCLSSKNALTGGLSSAPPPQVTSDPLAGPAPPNSQDLPRDQALQLSLAVVREMEMAKNDEGALEQWEKIEKLDPKNLQASRRLAVLYDRRTPPDWAAAEERYQKLAKALPNDADILSDWGYSYFLRNKWDDAEARLRQALKIDPKHPRAHGNLGLVLGQKKRPTEALQEFRAAGLSEAEAHCNLAFVYWSQGKLDDAKQECQRAQILDGSCEKARQMLAQLEAPPKPVVETKPNSRATAARRPADGRPRAATLTAEEWEKERDLARRAAEPPPMPPLPLAPLPGAAEQPSAPPTGPVWRTADGVTPAGASGHSGSSGTIAY